MKQMDDQVLHSVNFNFSFKVGDFGLSCLKNATYLTAKSGRGTVMIFSCFFDCKILKNATSFPSV